MATVLERFAAKVVDEPSTGCRVWTGSLDHRGYGWFKVAKRTLKAHRWAFEQANGEIQPGMFVCHKCDTPACVRIDHLFVGSNRDNVDDMVLKRRQAVGRGLPQAKMTEAQVIEARRLYSLGGYTQRSLAGMFGITHMPMGAILSGKTWKHLLTGVSH